MAGYKRDDVLFLDAQKIGARPVQELILRPQWGSLNFLDYEPDFELMSRFCKNVDLIDERVLTKRLHSKLHTQLGKIHSLHQDIETFDIKDTPNAKARYDSVVNNIGETVNGLVETGLPLLAGVPRLQNEPKLSDLELSVFHTQLEEVTKAAEHAEASRANAEEYSKALLGLLDDGQKAALALQESSARLGVAIHESDFSEEVKRLRRVRLGWLFASAFALSLTVAAAIALFVFLPVSDNYLRAAQQIVTKVFVLGALGAATVWCGSNYRATSHLFTVNRHRMNALRTFKTFIAAAETEEVRTAILLETTRTIFGATPTGFLPSGGDTVPEGAGKMIETLLKTAGKSGGTA